MIAPGVSAAGFVAARWLGYAAAFVVVGVATTAFLSPREDRLFARRLGLAAAGLGVVSLAARLVGQAGTLLDPGQPLSLAVVGQTIASRWGSRWELQGLAALLALLVFALRHPARAARWTAVFAAGAVAYTLPLTGHALEFPAGPRWGTLAHGTHLLAGGVWLGSLAVLVPTLWRTPVEGISAEVVATWRRFSTVALPAGVLTMLLGGLLAWVDVGRWSNLIATPYGRLLLAKLVLLGGILALGAHHWRRVLPQLPAASASRGLARTGFVEALVAFLLLGVTAVLVATPAPALL